MNTLRIATLAMGIVMLLFACYLEFQREVFIDSRGCDEGVEFSPGQKLMLNYTRPSTHEPMCAPIIYVNAYKQPMTVALQWLSMFVVSCCLLDMFGMIKWDKRLTEDGDAGAII